MSLFGWVLVFIALALLALAAIGVLAVRVWRQLKALTRDASRAGGQLSSVAIIRATPGQRKSRAGS